MKMENETSFIFQKHHNRLLKTATASHLVAEPPMEIDEPTIRNNVGRITFVVPISYLAKIGK